jgi:hypothetical protein
MEFQTLSINVPERAFSLPVKIIQKANPMKRRRMDHSRISVLFMAGSPEKRYLTRNEC